MPCCCAAHAWSGSLLFLFLLQVYRRYLKLEPTHSEEFIAYLKIKQLWGEAARVGAHLLDDCLVLPVLLLLALSQPSLLLPP